MKLRKLLPAILCLLTVASSARLFAQSPDQDPVTSGDTASASVAPALDWTWVNPLPHGNHLISVISRQNGFVAVGYNGTIQTSNDGSSWTVKPTGTRQPLSAIAVSPDALVAGGNNGTIVVSRDRGETWTASTTGRPGNITGLAYGNGTYVALTADPVTILASHDLATWSTVAEAPENVWLDGGVVFAQNQFVVAGSDGSVLRSRSGIDWETSTGPTRAPRLTYGAGNYIIAGEAGVFSSPDAGVWTKTWDGTIGSRSYSLHFSILTYLQGQFIALSVSNILTSTNGVNWNLGATLSSSIRPNGLTYGLGKYVGVGGNGATFVSSNLTQWTQTSARNTLNLGGVAFGPAGFVTAGASKGRSVDGVTWTFAPTLSTNYGSTRNAYVFNHRYWAIGASQLSSSLDGWNWTQTPLPAGASTAKFEALAYGNGQYVAVGNALVSLSPVRRENRVFVSRNALTWTRVTLPTTVGLSDITFDGSRFVAVGDNQSVVSSVDGVNWAIESTGGSEVFYRIVFNGRTYATVARSSKTAFSSTDLKNWAVADMAPGVPLEASGFSDLIVARDWFVALAQNGGLWFSKDGLQWDAGEGSIQNYTTSVAFGNNHLVVVTSDGSMVRSNALLPEPAP